MNASLSELLLAILAGVGGGGMIVAALAAWLGKVWADRLSQTQKYIGEIDLDLRKRRIEVYESLWKSTALLPKWPRAENVTYADLAALSQQLRQWYYDNGGMYLSRTSRDEGYGPLQGAIASVLSDDKTGVLSPGDYEAVRKKCSALRTMLTDDIESRRESPV
jgi:hypothetical protein